MAKWERWKSSEVARSKVPGFIQGWMLQGESKISCLFLMLINGAKEQNGFKNTCVAAEMERLSLDLIQAAKSRGVG